MNIVFLFAPKFKEFGVDVVRKLMSDQPSVNVIGLCTGSVSVVEYVKENLNIERGNVYDIEYLEKKWISLSDKLVDYDYLESIDKKYGIGTVGEVITSDRRIGLGFVRGGIARPDSLGDTVLNNSVEPVLKYLQGLFKFVEGLFDRHDLKGVFCYSVAGAPAVVLSKVCKSRDSTFTRLTTTRIRNGFVVDTDYKGLLEPISSEFKKNQLIGIEDWADARALVDSFRVNPVLPGYAIRNHAIAQKNKLLELSKNTVIYASALLATPILPKKIKNRVSKIGFRRKIFELKSECQGLFQRRLIEWQDIPKNKYIYYPLHVDPEASTMVLSPMHTDQISIIESISKSLPGDKVLVVKEHLPMLGKRPKGFYGQLKKLPRVVVVRPDLTGHEVIRQSQGVVVITGTSALEALLLKKRALVIGDSPYLIIGEGLVHEPSLDKLPDAIQALCDDKAIDDAELIRYIAIALEKSFEMRPSLLWGSYLAHPENERLKAVSDLANGIYESVKNG